MKIWFIFGFCHCCRCCLHLQFLFLDQKMQKFLAESVYDYNCYILNRTVLLIARYQIQTSSLHARGFGLKIRCSSTVDVAYGILFGPRRLCCQILRFWELPFLKKQVVSLGREFFHSMVSRPVGGILLSKVVAVMMTMMINDSCWMTFCTLIQSFSVEQVRLLEFKYSLGQVMMKEVD